MRWRIWATDRLAAVATTGVTMTTRKMITTIKVVDTVLRRDCPLALGQGIMVGYLKLVYSKNI